MLLKEKIVKGKHAFGLAARIAAAVVVIAVIIWKFKDLQNIDVRSLVDSSKNIYFAILAVWGVYLLKAITFVVPASLVYIAVGMAFPPAAAILINLVGIAVEVCVSYLAGIILGGEYVTGKLEKNKYGAKIISLQGKGKLSAIFLIRLLPVFPIDLVSLFLGAVRMKFISYLLISLGGIMPRVILFTILGDGIYDYIPMKQLMIAAAVLIPAALIIWIIKYALKSKKEEIIMEKPVFEPLSESRRYVIFDTDMGPDCDDAGAWAMLLKYAEKYDLKILGAANCTSNSYANGTIRAIAEYYGFDDVTVGQHTGDPMLPDGTRYNVDVAKKYFEDYKHACRAMTEKEFYKKLLSKAEDDSVTVITVGTFSNIAAALNDDPDLFNAKVNSVISMAGKFPEGKEFNITCDIKAAQTVIEKYKNTLIFTGWEIGADIVAGFGTEFSEGPVFDCYKLYSGRHEPPYDRSSWDLTAVHFAVEGENGLYELSNPVKVTFDDEGSTHIEKDRSSNRYYLLRKVAPDVIAGIFNDMIFDA